MRPAQPGSRGGRRFPRRGRPADDASDHNGQAGRAVPRGAAYHAGVATLDRRETDSGIEVKPVYTADDAAESRSELPGEYPFTRGPYRNMYRGRPWTIR